MAVPIPVVITIVQRGGIGASAMNHRKSQSDPIRIPKNASAKIAVPSRGDRIDSPRAADSPCPPIREIREVTTDFIIGRQRSPSPELRLSALHYWTSHFECFPCHISSCLTNPSPQGGPITTALDKSRVFTAQIRRDPDGSAASTARCPRCRKASLCRS